MKFSILLAVLPVAFAAPGSLKASEVAAIAARAAAGDIVCPSNVSLEEKREKDAKRALC